MLSSWCENLELIHKNDDKYWMKTFQTFCVFCLLVFSLRFTVRICHKKTQPFFRLYCGWQLISLYSVFSLILLQTSFRTYKKSFGTVCVFFSPHIKVWVLSYLKLFKSFLSIPKSESMNTQIFSASKYSILSSISLKNFNSVHGRLLVSTSQLCKLHIGSYLASKLVVMLQNHSCMSTS